MENQPQPKNVKLGSIWRTIVAKYEPISFMGEGSFGQVVKARMRSNGRVVAIKYIKNVFRNNYESRKVIREISILR